MSATDAGPTHTRWGIVLVVFFAGAVGAFQIGKLPASIPTMREDLGLSLVAAAWVLSLVSLIGALAGAGLGAVADWLGHRRVVIGGLLVAALAGFAGSAAQGQTGILVLRFIEGCGVIFAFVAGPTLLIRATKPAHLPIVLGAWGAYMPVGVALMVLITPGLITVAGWRGVWIANAVLLAVYAGVVYVTTRDLAPPPGQARSADRLRRLGPDLWLTLKGGGPLLLGLAFTMHSANFLAVFSFLPTILIEEAGVSAGAAAALTALGIVMNGVGNVAGGLLLNMRIPRWQLMVLASVVTGVSSIGIYWSGMAVEYRLLLCVLLSFTSGMLPACAFAATPLFAPRPDLVGTANGIIVQGANIGNVAGPPLLAAVVALTGSWQAAPWLICAMAGLGVVFSIWVGVLEHRRRK